MTEPRHVITYENRLLVTCSCGWTTTGSKEWVDARVNRHGFEHRAAVEMAGMSR